jgi:hypothetical protein
MALPVILVDSATGSDTQASGAGPSTALFGTTNASTSGTGLVVTLPAGTDLSGVSTSGSDVIYLADATAGNRNFSKITATAGSGGATPTVTVANAFGLTLSNKSWAIGGKRATISGTISVKLFENNSAAGDAMPGWVVEMQSGHSEILNNTPISLRRAGDTTSGPIILRGVSGAATLPKLSMTANVDCFYFRNEAQQFRDFELSCESASNGNAIRNVSGNSIVASGLKFTHTSTNKWQSAIIRNVDIVVACEIAYGAAQGILFEDNVAAYWNYIHDVSTVGIDGSSGSGGGQVIGNIIYSASAYGIRLAITASRPTAVIGNTVDTCGVHGIYSSAAVTTAANFGHVIANNIISNCGGYGIFFGGVSTSADLTAFGIIITNNDTYNNTSGPSLPAGINANDPGLNPTYTSAATGDFSIGTNLKEKGYPLGGTVRVGTYSGTYSYPDIGAAQRHETGSGDGYLLVAN